MKLPLQVTFRNMARSEAAEAKIRERAADLDHFCDCIMSCRVVVEQSHHHHHQGNLFQVGIDLKVPDDELTVSRHPSGHHAHEDVYVAIRDAFDEIRRQLQDYTRRRRADVKKHAVPLHGRICELDPVGGMIETPDGREVSFHRNAVVEGSFDNLEIGDELRFVEAAGEAEPRATTVHIVGKHHVID